MEWSAVRTLELKIPPPVQWLFFALLTWLAAWALPQCNFPFAGHRLLALVLAAAGAACGLAGVIAFRQAQTTADPHRPERARTVVSHGIYRHTRNPMYLGLALVLAALACWWATAWGLVTVTLFCTGITRLQILPEERALQAAFGSTYQAYRQHVRRWL